jgi:hypothetical protein
MENVYVLFRRLEDKYGCLEDNERDILGIFATEEQANNNRDLLKKEDTRKKYEIWVESYELNKLQIF